jgi:hypothetical protein
VTVTQNTASNWTIDALLAQGVSFHGDKNSFFWFDVESPASVLFQNATLTGGSHYTFDGIASAGADQPGSGSFPGTYNYLASCTTLSGDAGKLCGNELKFTVYDTVGAPIVLGAPLAGGLFPGVPMMFVAVLSVDAAACAAGAGCVTGTGLVGAPEPSTWAMLALGFAGLGFAGYRKARGQRVIAD